jgi:hypothetical protein
MLGKIYLKLKIFMNCKTLIIGSFKTFFEKSAGNFSFSTNVSTVTKNTYNKFYNLPKISEHVTKHKSDLNDKEFGFFLAGLIEGDG